MSGNTQPLLPDGPADVIEAAADVAVPVPPVLGGAHVTGACPPVPPYAAEAARPAYSTLTEPIGVTLKRDVDRVAFNLRCVLAPPLASAGVVQGSGSGNGGTGGIGGGMLREWDLWGPFLFTVSLALVLSSSASENKTRVFAVVFGTVSLGAVVLTLNVLLLGGRIIMFQSLSVLGYCLFPLDVGAFICLFVTNKLLRMVVVTVTLLWSVTAAYPFVARAVPEARRVLAVYPVLLLYIAIGFLVLAND